MDRYFGCHVSSSGGFVRALHTAHTLGVNTIQIHPSPPQRWNTKPFPHGVEKEFLEYLPQSGVVKLFFHGIYLINLAHPEKRSLDLAQLSLTHDLELLSRMSGAGVIFHVGSMKHESDFSAGLKRAADTISAIFQNTPLDSRLLLEVAAGSGAVIGQRFEELVEIYQQVENSERLGFALDTQHLWASGCNLHEDFESLLDRIESSVGLQKIEAIHLNDSKSDLGSRIDRHENIGEGKIGFDILQKIVGHPKLHSIPIILETPGLKEPESASVEVSKLRQMILGW